MTATGSNVKFNMVCVCPTVSVTEFVDNDRIVFEMETPCSIARIAYTSETIEGLACSHSDG